MNKSVVVIGAGIAGIEAANTLANFGYNVFVVEKEKNIGGNINNWYHLFPNSRDAQEIRNHLIDFSYHPNINIFKETEITEIVKKDKKFVVNTNKALNVNADAVLVSTGFKPFSAERKEEYGYKIYDNVITSVDLERKLQNKEQILTAQGTTPKRIAFVHCVGSRDAKSGNTYCSKLCCITGVKQAIEMNKKFPEAEMYCFYMDLRMHGLEYETFYRDAQEKHNTQFIRGRVSEVSENFDKSIQLKAEDTLTGLPLKMKVDMLVLLVGMEPSENSEKICKMTGVEINSNRFIQPKDVHIKSNISNIDGIFLAGTCTGPMTINETVQNSKNAALEIHNYLKN